MKRIISLILSVVLLFSCLSGCTSNNKKEPVYTGETEGYTFYMIKYPEGKGINELFGIVEPNHQASCPVSVFEPNNTMIVSGADLSDSSSIVYGNKDFFIFYCNSLNSESFSKLATKMISTSGMEYEDGLQYIEDYIVD